MRRSLAARFSTATRLYARGREKGYETVREPLPDPMPERVALYPIAPGEDTTQVGVLDFDDHHAEVEWSTMIGTARPVVDHLRKLGHHPMPFRSTGGRGVHVWLVWDAPQSAAGVITLLDDALAACGLDRGAGGVVKGEVEVFPKQAEVPENRVGNPVALPLAGESIPLHPDGLDPLTKPRLVTSSPPVKAPPEPEPEDGADEFDAELVKSALEAIPAADYGTWIDVLRALLGGAVRAGKDPDGEVRDLALAWSKTVPSVFDQRTFDYKWSRGFARERAGKGRTLGTLFHHARMNGWEFPDRPAHVERIRIQESDPPLFLVTISGSNMEVPMTDADVCSPLKFQQAVLRRTYRLVDRPKRGELDRMLARAERIPADESATELGRFKGYLFEFIEQYKTEERDQIDLDRPWHDTERQRFWFRWKDVEHYFRKMRVHGFEHSRALHHVRSLGGGDGALKVRGRTVRCWWVPADDLPPKTPLRRPDTRPRGDDVPF